MSLKLNERYPGRFDNPSADYPQGSFKNRTTPDAKDGSYLEKDWANDKEGFFQSVLSAAGVVANGNVDKVGSSQFFDALLQLLQGQAGIAFTTGGTATALTLTPVPAIQGYAKNQSFSVNFSVSSGLNPTLNVSGKGAKSLKQYDSNGAKVAALFVVDQVSYVVYDGTDFIVLNSLPTNISLGQCRLAKSGANIVLTPRNGNKLTISGLPQSVPSAGVSLAPTGLTPGTLYYIYAYMSAGVMTLEASTTAHSADVSTGVEIKTGDATRTLVGMTRPIAGPAFQDAPAQRFVLSYFNRKDVSAKGIFAATFSTASTTYVELSSTTRAEFLTWGDELVKTDLSGTVTPLVGGNSLIFCGISFDGGSPEDGALISTCLNANYTVPACPSAKKEASEGYHYATIMGKATNSQTLQIIGAASSPDRAVLTATIRG